jgi:hypothetical protein
MHVDNTIGFLDSVHVKSGPSMTEATFAFRGVGARTRTQLPHKQNLS